MSVRARHIATTAVFAAATILSGCASINEKMAPILGDNLPMWAGGMPKDVPPRPGTPEYEAYMKELERKQLKFTPANAAAPASSSPTQLEPGH